MKKNKVVISYGTFDLFHIGHLRLIQRLVSMGDKLVIGISTDGFNEKKNKSTVIPYQQRAEIVRNIQGVSHVFPEQSWDQKKHDIEKYDADIFVMGDDWEGEFDFLNTLCEVCYLPRTKDISTTKLKKCLRKESYKNYAKPTFPDSEMSLSETFA